jgi:NAD(P)H dehydrogenase (quinone)
MSKSSNLFVNGASGNLGRRVIQLLLERGQAGNVVAGTRTPETLTGVAGVEVRQTSYYEPAALAKAFEGTERLLMISSGGPERTEQHRNAVRAAQAAGVRHIVYTSMINPDEDSPIPFAHEHRHTEEAIKASGIDHTILRVVWYAENLIGQLNEAIKHGEWLSAAGDGRIAYARREDCARAAAGALLAANAGSRTLDVTGPAALTTQEIIAIGSKVSGKPIAVVDLNDADMRAKLLAAGMPEAVLDTFVIPFERNTREGRIDVVSNAVEELWGTPAQGLEDFLREHRAELLAP